MDKDQRRAIQATSKALIMYFEDRGKTYDRALFSARTLVLNATGIDKVAFNHIFHEEF